MSFSAEAHCSAIRPAQRPNAPEPRPLGASTAAAHGRAGTVLDYRHYFAFSWSWSWRRTVLFGFFAVLLGLGEGAANGLLLDDGRLGWIDAACTAADWLCIVSLGPLLAAAVRSRGWAPDRERIGVVVVVLLSACASFAAQSLANRIVFEIVVPRALEQRVIDAGYLARVRAFSSTFTVLASDAALYFVLSGGLALRTYFVEQRRSAEAARDRAVGELKLHQQQVDLRLLMLQAQLEPHFLFNTLASLRSLLRQDVDRAEAMVDALVEHLRAALPVTRAMHGTSTLWEQVRLCSSYLDLMTIRLPDRLRYAISVPQTLGHAPFPPLILLTLVENAVKHGIEPKPGPGYVHIDATRADRDDGPHLIARVIDDGLGLAAGIGHGVGLSNIRAQLALKYHGRASLSLIAGAAGGTIATLDIPDESAGGP